MEFLCGVTVVRKYTDFYSKTEIATVRIRVIDFSKNMLIFSFYDFFQILVFFGNFFKRSRKKTRMRRKKAMRNIRIPDAVFSPATKKFGDHRIDL